MKHYIDVGVIEMNHKILLNGKGDFSCYEKNKGTELFISVSF